MLRRCCVDLALVVEAAGSRCEGAAVLHYSDTYLADRVGGLTPTVGQEWDVVLDVPDPGRVDARHLHAVVSAWFDRSGPGGGARDGGLKWCPELVESGGHSAPAKPYAVGPVWERPDGRSGFSLRILGGAIERPEAVERVRLGSQQAVVDWSGSSLLRSVRVADLMELPSALSVFLRFETPVTRRRADVYHPVPTEASILESWERVAAVLGIDGAVDWRGVARIVHLNGHTAVWPSPKGRGRRRDPIGFVGDVGIEVPVTHGRRLHQLAVLASFAGTGAHTTFGMGFTTLMAVEGVER